MVCRHVNGTPLYIVKVHGIFLIFFVVRMCFGLKCNCATAHFGFLCIRLDLATKVTSGHSTFTGAANPAMIPGVLHEMLLILEKAF
jgi:hypothetical protein